MTRNASALQSRSTPPLIAVHLEGDSNDERTPPSKEKTMQPTLDELFRAAIAKALCKTGKAERFQILHR